MKEELNKLVNTSGFPFQLAVEHIVRQTHSAHGWTPIVREHPWKDPEDEDNGYIDLMLEKNHWQAVLECKRSQDAKWIFLLPKGEPTTGNTFRTNWIAAPKGHLVRVGIQEFALKPSLPESQFCVVRGSGEQGPTLLERLASTLMASIEALIAHEATVRTASRDFAHMYVPIIVTNASLYTCVFNPGAISLKSGRIDVDQAEYSEVPFVSFRKTLRHPSEAAAPPRNLPGENRTGQRCILIVNSEYLTSFLKDIEIDKADAFDTMPWHLKFEKE